MKVMREMMREMMESDMKVMREMMESDMNGDDGV